MKDVQPGETSVPTLDVERRDLSAAAAGDRLAPGSKD